jgi:hypothetical protein
MDVGLSSELNTEGQSIWIFLLGGLRALGGEIFLVPVLDSGSDSRIWKLGERFSRQRFGLFALSLSKGPGHLLLVYGPRTKIYFSEQRTGFHNFRRIVEHHLPSIEH